MGKARVPGGLVVIEPPIYAKARKAAAKDRRSIRSYINTVLDAHFKQAAQQPVEQAG